MKNLLTLFVLFLGLGLASAQEKKALTFDETIIYLKRSLDKKARYSEVLVYDTSTEYSTNYMGEVLISSDGKISCNWKVGGGGIYSSISFNLNKVLKIENQNAQIRFYVTDSSYYLITAESQIDAERITKAFIHLKSLLPKDDDPFAN